MTKPLPRPVTVADKYLAAIVARLDTLIELQPGPITAEPIMAELVSTEPEIIKMALPVTDLDLPNHLITALQTAGLEWTYQIPTAKADLIQIPGIGAASAKKIREAIQ